MSERLSLGERRVGIPAPPGERACSVCGCWEFDACWTPETGARWWETSDTCAFCADGGPPGAFVVV